MTVTSIDPRTALVVVDLQKGIVALPTAQPIGEVVANAAALADAFRRHGLPVVLVNVAGAAPGRTEVPRVMRDLPPGWTELIPELNRQPRDHLVTKHTPGAFTGTGLEAHLRELGVTQVAVAGVATSNGVEVTARQAFELGFNVTLAVDAMTDIRAEAHAYCLTQVFPRIGETGTTQEIIGLLPQECLT
jgi:nicotinamidase-related amidase